VINEQSMAEAMWLEKRYWENMGNAVQSGISKAFN